MKGFSSLLKRLISAIRYRIIHCLYSKVCVYTYVYISRQSPSLVEEVLSCASDFLDTIAVLSTAGGDLLPLSLLKCAVCEDGEEDLLGQLLTVLQVSTHSTISGLVCLFGTLCLVVHALYSMCVNCCL